MHADPRHRRPAPVPPARAGSRALVVGLAGAALGVLAVVLMVAVDATDTRPPGPAPPLSQAPSQRADGGSPGPAAATGPGAARAARLPARAAPADARWRRALSVLLARRAQAYASADPAMLRRVVFPPGSPVLAEDRAVLRAWQRRGLTVSATVQLGRVRLVARSPGRAVLRTSDALVGAVATASDGTRRRLPDERPVAHRVLLVSTDRGWRIGAVQRWLRCCSAREAGP